MDLKSFCSSTNVNYEDLTGRFMGSESLCLKFIKKFADDPSYNELQNSLNVNDYPVIERSAHTLKGIAANLGFNELFELSNTIVQNVRNNKYDDLSQINENLKQEYNKIILAISQLD